MSRELIEYIAKSLVDNPDEVSVAEVERDQAVVLELSVVKEDLGKVIGKQGRTARAMRTLLSAASAGGKRCAGDSGINVRRAPESRPPVDRGPRAKTRPQGELCIELLADSCLFETFAYLSGTSEKGQTMHS